MRSIVTSLIGILLVGAMLAGAIFLSENETLKATVMGALGNLLHITGDITIFVILLAIAVFSTIIFFKEILEKRNSTDEVLNDENYPKIINLSFLFGTSAALELMIIIIMLNASIEMPSFINSIIIFIIIFFFLLLCTHKRMYVEVAPLLYLFYQDPWTKKKRVVPEGTQFTSFLESLKETLDTKSMIEFNITEDYQTTTRGALINTKTSVMYTLKLGDQDTSIVDKTKAAIKFIIKKAALEKAVVVLVKKIQKDFYTNHSIKAGLTAESEDIFEHDKFKEFETDFPVEFAEISVYDAQTDAETLAQDREIRNAQNFRQIIRILRSGKDGISKEAAETIAPYLAGFNWSKTVDENTYRVIVEGLPEDLGKLITPQTIAAIGAVVGKGRGSKKKTNSPPKTTP